MKTIDYTLRTDDHAQHMMMICCLLALLFQAPLEQPTTAPTTPVPTTAPTTAPASRPAGPTLRADAPEPVRIAWEKREAVRAKHRAAIEKKLNPLLENLQLINEGRIDPKLNDTYKIERPIPRYIFKNTAVKAQHRKKAQAPVDDLRRQLAVIETTPFPLPFVAVERDLFEGNIAIFGAAGQPGLVTQIVDQDSLIVQLGVFQQYLLIDGINTSGMRVGTTPPKPIPVWIQGETEIEIAQGKRQTVRSAQHFRPEAYLSR